MPRDEFDVVGEYFQVKEHVGALVLFTPTEHLENVVTAFNPGGTDAMLTDLVVLHKDGEACEDEYDQSLIFQGALIAKLKSRVTITPSLDRDPVTGIVTEFETLTSKRVLGRIQRGEAKKGQSEPYIIGEVSDEDKDLARKYIAANPMPEPIKRKVKQYIETGPTQAVVQSDASPVQVRDEFGAAPAAQAPPAPQPDTDDDDPFAKGL